MKKKEETTKTLAGRRDVSAPPLSLSYFIGHVRAVSHAVKGQIHVSPVTTPQPPP